MKMSCLIIDDEPVARKGIAEYVGQIEFLHLAGHCENAVRATAMLEKHDIHLLFLDINMPGLSGLAFLRTLKDAPLAIITTAHPGYALEGYDLDIVDYLVKPVTFERFLKASQKAKEVFRLRRQQHTHEDAGHFFVKSNNRFEKIFFQQVLFIEALQNYVVIHLTDRKLIAYLKMSSLDEQLPADQFLKVHKSYIINVTHVRSIEGSEIHIGTARIPISRSLREGITTTIMGNRLLKR